MTLRSRFMFVLLCALAGATSAQDYLGNHLETVRENNLRNHQNEMRKPHRTTPKPRAKTRPPERPVGQADRQRAWNLNASEYRQRMLQDGRPAADRWLDRQARAAASPAGQPGTRRAGKASLESCRKVRYVVRPRPDTARGGMNLARVPVCAD